jgi:23S rRNA (guanosine2251-2'-O)-methyltransferase
MRTYPKKKEKSCKSRLIYGWHVVYEHLRVLPSQFLEIYLAPSLLGTKIGQLAYQTHVPVVQKTFEFLDTVSQGGVHQGVVARLLPFRYTLLQDLLNRQANLLLVLDGIVDPRNLGALLRTAEGAGVGGVILTNIRSASISALVEKTATGATAHLPICRVDNLSRSLSIIKQKGYWLVGLVQNAPQLIYEVPVLCKVALLLGGEEKGLRVLTRQGCDFLAAIPMSGHIESLNVSVAGGIALYELLRKRRYDKIE